MEIKENSQKVELIINRQDQQETATEIDLVNVFSNMGRRKRVFLPLVAMLLILGLILPMLIAELSNKSPDAQAVVQMNYEDAQAVSFPSFVLQQALDDTLLSESLTATQLERNITVEQLLSEATRQRLEVLEQEVSANQSNVSEASEISLDYEDIYIVTLSNGFGGENSGKQVYLEAAEIRDLLDNVIGGYNTYLYESTVDFLLPEVDLSAVSLNDLEYVERLDVIRGILNTLEAYCKDNQTRFPGYRSATNGLSFADLSENVALVRSVDVNYLYSFIKLRGVAENASLLQNKWIFTLRNTQLALDEIESRIESNNTIIQEYQNETIALSSMDGEFSQNTSVTTEYYNTLVRSQMQLYDRKAELEQEILDLEDKISTSSQNASPDMLRYVEAEYAYVYRDALGVQQLVIDYAEELQSSDTVTNSYITSTGAQVNADGFFSADNLKKAATGGVVGLVIALVIWAAAGLAEELKKEGPAYGKERETAGESREA